MHQFIKTRIMRNKQRGSRRQQKSQFNTSSFADIAFLVLIFFLVTASKTPEQGIKAKLPPYNCDIGCHFGIKERNILRVNLDEKGQLFINKKNIPITRLRKISKEFIINPNRVEALSEKPDRAIVYFYYKKETPYNEYLTTMNEVIGAYHEIWEEVAFERFGYHYKHLNQNEKRSIWNNFPKFITEVEFPN